MAETAEGIVREVSEREFDTKYGKRTKYTLKLDVNGDSLSFQTWNDNQAKFARDLLNDERMVKVDWEQEDSWKDRDGNERPGARAVKEIAGPLKDAQKPSGDRVWADKDVRIVRQNAWRHACSLAPYVFINRDPEEVMSVSGIYDALAPLARMIETHILKGTDLEEQYPEDIPFLTEEDEPEANPFHDED